MKPRVDLPVGQNLEDHVTTALMPFSINRTDIVVNPDRDFGLSLLYDIYVKGMGRFMVHEQKMRAKMNHEVIDFNF